jgi:processive 1,2-diacylglycerol beta-glucosyltransferase
MPPRVLVLSASVGAGHLRAAEAVELALKESVPDATVRNLDVLEMTNALFRRVYGEFYLDLVNKAPHALGYFYDLMDQPSKSGKHRADRLRLVLEKLNLKPFVRFLQAEPWDLVINTHFLPAEIIASLRQSGTITLPQVTATTDFDTHRLWVNPPCERYFAATTEGALYLRHWGVPAEIVAVTGIPIHPVFSRPKDPGECRRKHGLAEDRPVVLQLSGGFGVGPIEKLFNALLQVQRPIHLVTITGRNEKLKEELRKHPVPDRHRATVMGFTREIDELMAAADLVVSKPGGLTTSEVLARGAVMVIVNPIPGQESRNSDYLLENGAAIKVNNTATLAYKIDQLLQDPARLDQLRANVRRIAHPRAAFDVVEQSLKVISGRHTGARPNTSNEAGDQASD